MTDFEMLKALLLKAGRIYDEAVIAPYNKKIVQVHVTGSRIQFEFNSEGELLEEWDNPYESQWIGSPYFEG